jgi:hypothetical protein
LAVYGRFLSISTKTTPTMAIAMMIAIPVPITYMSVFDCTACTGAGDTAGARVDALIDLALWNIDKYIVTKVQGNTRYRLCGEL